MREYGKKDINKPKKTNNTIICSNLQQSACTYPLTCQGLTSKQSVYKHQFQNNMCTYRFHQLITYYNAKYSSVRRISAINFISSDLTSKIGRIYQITIKLFLSAGVKFSTIDWLVLINNRWTKVDGPRDNTTQYYYSLYHNSKEERKEGRKSIYINIQTVQLQDINSLRFLKYSQCSQNILYWSMLPLTLVLFRLEGIHKELHFLQHVDFRELTIYLQYRIVYIIVIYVFCMLLKHTNN